MTLFCIGVSVMFSVSAPCFEAGVLPYLFFKATLRECDRYFVLFLHFCFLYQLLFPFTLYSLPESLSDASLGLCEVGLMGCDFKLCNNFSGHYPLVPHQGTSTNYPKRLTRCGNC